MTDLHMGFILDLANVSVTQGLYYIAGFWMQLAKQQCGYVGLITLLAIPGGRTL